MTELRQVIANLRTVDTYLDQFLYNKALEFESLLEENKKLKEEINKLKNANK